MIGEAIERYLQNDNSSQNNSSSYVLIEINCKRFGFV